MKTIIFTTVLLLTSLNVFAWDFSYYAGPGAEKTYKALKVPVDTYTVPTQFGVVPEQSSVSVTSATLHIKEAPGVICVADVKGTKILVHDCRPHPPAWEPPPNRPGPPNHAPPRPCGTRPIDEVEYYCQAVSQMYHRPQDVIELWNVLNIPPETLSNGVVIKSVGQISVAIHEDGKYSYGVSYTNASWLGKLIALGEKAIRLYNVLDVPIKTYQTEHMVQQAKETDTVKCYQNELKGTGKLPSFLKSICASDPRKVE